MKITLLSGREIGNDCKPFIIAEVGSNWTCLLDCFDSIEQAKLSNADAVKFQLFNDLALYGMNRRIAALNSDGEYAMKDVPNKYALPQEWLPKLKAHADLNKIEFMCSAFSPELIKIVDPFVNIHKLASSEMTHVRMLETLSNLKKPVIMSTGASTEIEITQSLKILKFKPVLLYCVSNYPAREINLENIRALENRFSTLVGYSDHSTDICVIPGRAVEKGACVIEKHFTAIIDTNTPDFGHSLNPGEFKKMVKCIYEGQQAELTPQAEETPMIQTHNRRLIAIKNIKAGDTLKENENFGIFRSIESSNYGLSPFMVNEVNGKIANQDIAKGKGIWEIW